MKLGKLLLAVAGAAVLLGAFVSTAAARELLQTAETQRATWRELTFAGGFGRAVCGITLEGSLHSRTIRKVVGSLLGYVTRAILQKPCPTGDATILTESLPWHIQYLGFRGILPNITALVANVIGASFRSLEPVFGLACLTRSSASRPGIGTYAVSAGVVTSVTLGGRIPTSCGIDGELSGTSTNLTVLSSAARISVRLI